jgi:hypothetical protein
VKYELSVADRVSLVQILSSAPKMGSYLYFKEFSKVSSQVSIGEPEQKAIDWVQGDDRITWNAEKAKVKTVEIADCVAKIIKNALVELDKNEQLHPEHIPVYEMFVGEENEVSA